MKMSQISIIHYKNRMREQSFFFFISLPILTLSFDVMNSCIEYVSIDIKDNKIPSDSAEHILHYSVDILFSAQHEEKKIQSSFFPQSSTIQISTTSASLSIPTIINGFMSQRFIMDEIEG